MRNSYDEKDVILLLKDLTGKIQPQTSEEMEKMIRNGSHYCEMLPLEKRPSDKYMEIYNEVLERFAKVNAEAIANLSHKIIEKRGKNVVLVSLARAGIPVGILIKHYMKKYFNLDVDHYAISIIRGKGIDKNAMKFLLEKYNAKDLVFVDGWTGKGAIKNQVEEAINDYDGVNPELAVIADPACVTNLYGTRDDILIPCACLNSIVSGLVSRTILRDDLIGENDYHGCVYISDLEEYDISYQFIERIEKEFTSEIKENTYIETNSTGLDEAKKLAEKYGIDDFNFVKPSIGETTRVLLRRTPWRVLINNDDKNSEFVQHIICLANEKNVPIEYVDLKHYKCVGLVKDLGDV